MNKQELSSDLSDCSRPHHLQAVMDAGDLHILTCGAIVAPALMNAAMAAGFHDMITPLIEMHAAGRSAEAVEL